MTLYIIKRKHTSYIMYPKLVRENGHNINLVEHISHA